MNCKKCGSFEQRKTYLDHLNKTFKPIGWTRKHILTEYQEYFSQCRCSAAPAGGEEVKHV